VKKAIGEKNIAHTIVAALFSISLIFGMSVANLFLQQPAQQDIFASSQAQGVPPTQKTTPNQMLLAPTSTCNPNSPTLQLGFTGTKVAELQRLLVQLGYGSMLGQGGIDGKFGTDTQNAVKKFQQDNRLPANGIVRPVIWRTLCTLVTSAAPSPTPLPSSQPIQMPAQYQRILDKLRLLAYATAAERTTPPVKKFGSPNFDDAILLFSNELERQLKALDLSRPIPPSPLRITVEALNLWLADTGKIWGTSDKTADYNSPAQCYATVKGDDSKCNIYVAEVIYGATGITQMAHAERGETGRYFPYRAAEWADTSKFIPYFRLDNANPNMGDIWAAITEVNTFTRNLAHVGIYLGEYAGVKLYISARDNGNGVYGIGRVQHEDGIQVKELVDPGKKPPKGGVFREYDPALAPPPARPPPSSDIREGCIGMKC
jgi:peptidoglycan hydrolase-like protein with peptidoglycan-binding domain